MTALTQNSTTTTDFPIKKFILTCIIVSVWINAAEIFRYFLFIMPMLREHLAAIPNVAPMNLSVFLIWAVWDTILVIMAVTMYWLCAERFGSTNRTVIIASTLSWAFLFLLFWIAMLNINLATFDMLVIALPLAWIEMLVAGFIAKLCFSRS